jgi:putative ABC transport system permease protein
MKEIFSDGTVHSFSTFQLTAEGQPERTIMTVTSGNYFATLRIDAALGRVYTPEEGGIGGEAVIVLDHAYWQNRFGGDPSVVGQTVTINDLPVTVIGVTPESFQGTQGFVRAMAYVPFSTREQLEYDFKEYLEERGSRGWNVVARLQKGVSLDEARAAVSTMAANLEKEYPEVNDQMRANVFPEPQARLEPAAADYLPPVVAIFMVLVSLVLLIACANAANLLLARASERRREMALRSALGAGRARVMRQFLTESLLISIAGGAAGLVMAFWAGNFLSSIRVASDLPLQFDFSMDYRVFGYAFLVALVAGVITGLAPGFHAARANIVDALKEGGRTGAGSARQPLRSILVAAQVAISLVLLVCTALFLQSMRHVTETDPGFQMQNRVMLTVDTTLRNYEDEKGRAFFRDLLDRVRTLPGVRSAATARFIPMGYENSAYRIYVEGEGEGLTEEQDSSQVFYNNVSPDYFTTMGIPILEGRAITEQDNEDARMVAVVNEKMAEQFWPDGNPMGKRFSVEGPDGPFWEVIGIAKQGFYLIPGEPPVPFFYRPLEQALRLQQTLFVHAQGEPTNLLPAIREEIRALDADMPIFDVRTLESHVKEGKAVLLFHIPAQLVGAFATIGAVLAALGLYGVIAYSVTQRTHEIGIRVALGASSSSIVRLVLSKGVLLGALGIGLGVLLAIAVTSTFAFLLVGVSAKDPTTYVVVSLLVMAVALTACFIPARFRAARIDPVIALRDE